MQATLLNPAQDHTAAPGRLLHGAHIECQEGAPFVTLACGIAADWDERGDADPGSGTVRGCPGCHQARRCPLCGTKLVKR